MSARPPRTGSPSSLLAPLSSFLQPLFELLRRRIPDRSPLGLARTYPATILLLATIVLSDLVTWGQPWETYEPNVLNRLGLDWDTLVQGQVYRIFTSTFVQSVSGIHFSMVVVLLTAYVLAETFAGSAALICVVFLSDWFASVMGLLTFRLLAELGSERAASLLHSPDAGSSATAHGAYALAAATLLPRKLAIGLFTLLLTVTAVLFFEQQIGASVAHTYSALFGGAVGWFILRPRLYPEEYGRA